MMSEARLAQDQQTADAMIAMYCQARHGGSDSLCVDCKALAEYAHARLEHCPHGDNKPMCHACEIHCYKPAMRARITDVMRVVGPLMAARRSFTRPAQHSNNHS